MDRCRLGLERSLLTIPTLPTCGDVIPGAKVAYSRLCKIHKVRYHLPQILEVLVITEYST